MPRITRLAFEPAVFRARRPNEKAVLLLAVGGVRFKKEGEKTEPSDQGLPGCSPEVKVTREEGLCQAQPLGGEGAVPCKETASKGTEPS